MKDSFQPRLELSDPSKMVDSIVLFLKSMYAQQSKKNGVIAVSGGIDSAVSLVLLTRALGVENVYPVFLPYGQQSVADSQRVCAAVGIPETNRVSIDIEPIVTAFCEQLELPSAANMHDPTSETVSEKYRVANAMARARMMVIYDQAKYRQALVCGTENKSEKYLGYFTRFGDEASDIEPIQHLYKTQIRQLAEYLDVPGSIQEKAPSAGLWSNQTDEAELGFTYQDADAVIDVYLQLDDQEVASEATAETAFAELVEQIAEATDVPSEVVAAVLERVAAQSFKHQVPYVYGVTKIDSKS